MFEIAINSNPLSINSATPDSCTRDVNRVICLYRIVLTNLFLAELLTIAMRRTLLYSGCVLLVPLPRYIGNYCMLDVTDIT